MGCNTCLHQRVVIENMTRFSSPLFQKEKGGEKGETHQDQLNYQSDFRWLPSLLSESGSFWSLRMQCLSETIRPRYRQSSLTMIECWQVYRLKFSKQPPNKQICHGHQVNEWQPHIHNHTLDPFKEVVAAGLGNGVAGLERLFNAIEKLVTDLQ